MSLLLDTHAVLWFVLDDKRLSSVAKSAIANELDGAYISPASYWELAIKIGVGTYTLTVPFEDFWQTAITRGKLTVLPIGVSHAAKIMELPFIHRDPFDRMLLAQALVENHTLVSCDTVFDRYGVSRIW